MTQNNLDFGAYTDFGELCAVIVGSAEGLTLPPFNPTLHHYNDEVQAALKASGDQPLDIRKAMPERWRKTVEQLDHLAALYEKNGIQVYRPRPASKRKAKPIRFSPSGGLEPVSWPSPPQSGPVFLE